MLKFRNNKWLLFLAVVAVIITVIEGGYYYSNYIEDFGLLVILMIIQNSIGAFFFNPTVSILDVLENIESAGMTQVIIANLYGISVFLASFCTVAAVIQFIELLLKNRLFKMRYKNKECIVFLGFNKDADYLLSKSNTREYRLEVITKETLTDDKHLKLLKRGIFTEQIDLLDLSKEKLEKWIKKKKYPRKTTFLFFNDNVLDNISLAVHFQETFTDADEYEFKLNCPDNTFRLMIEDSIKDRKRIQIINLNEFHTYKMFSEVPIQNSVLNDQTVHMLIAGLGDFGEEVLRQTIQLGVLTKDNKILIDVVDKNGQEKKEHIQSFFRKEVLDNSVKENEIRINSAVADGELLIRFHSVNTTNAGFSRVLHKISRNEPLTYAVLSLGDPNELLSSLNQLMRFLTDRHYKNNIPIGLVFPSNRKNTDFFMKTYEKKNTGSSEIMIYKVFKNSISIKEVLNKKNEKECYMFHSLYNEFYTNMCSYSKDIDINRAIESLTDNPSNKNVDSKADWESKWNMITAFNKESTRWQQKRISILYGKHNRSNLKKVLQQSGINTNIIPKEYFTGKDFVGTELEQMMAAEHRRWNYYFLYAGYVSLPLGSKTNIVNDKRKYAIVPWKELNEYYSREVPYDMIPYLIYAFSDKDNQIDPLSDQKDSVLQQNPSYVVG